MRESNNANHRPRLNRPRTTTSCRTRHHVAARAAARYSKSACSDCGSSSPCACAHPSCGSKTCPCPSVRSSRRAALVAAASFAPLLLANSAYAGGLPSPTNVDDMEKRKMAREEILKAARAKAAAQAAPAAAPEAAAPPASE